MWLVVAASVRVVLRLAIVSCRAAGFVCYTCLRGLVEVSAPVADDGISEEARQAVLMFGSPTVDSEQSRQHDL